MERVLYSYTVSPYAAKVRAVLQWKQLDFREDIVHPLRRGEVVRRSGQKLVPVLVDGDRVVADSTRIVAYLEEKYPEKPVYPSDPVERGRARLLEEWADEGLPGAVQPVRWLIPMNYERELARLRAGYPPGRADDLAMAGVGQIIRLYVLRKYGPRLGFGSPARYLNRMAEVLDDLDAAIPAGGFLLGAEPCVADFAVAAWIAQLRGLDGWETVKMRRKVVKLAKALIPETEEGKETAASANKGEGPKEPAKAEAYDPEDQALIEASRLRRAAKGKL
jgi:glutathione S-transferase